MRRVAILFLLSGALAACALISGAADLEIVSPEPDAAAEAETPPPPPPPPVEGGVDAGSACSGTCVAAPTGFEGPFAVRLGDDTTPLACPPGLARAWERSGASLDAAAQPAECTCTCGGGTSCSLTLTEYSIACSSFGIPRAVQAGACAELSTATFRVSGSSTSACAPDASVRVPAFGGGAAIGCGTDDRAGCTSGVCLPPVPSDARVCVRPIAGGAQACPAAFPEELSLKAGTEDTRGCTPCRCGRTSTSCAVDVDAFSLSMCAGSATKTDGGCTTVRGADSVRVVDAGAPPCVPEGGAPKGGVTTAPAVTLCCAR